MLLATSFKHGRILHGPHFHHKGIVRPSSSLPIFNASATTPKRRGRPPKPPSSTNILSPSKNLKHHDLPSFEAHAARTNLSPTSTVYLGTRYEYTVLTSLSRLGFSLTRIGGASDLGLDLVGSWTVCGTERRVMLQCKAMAASPAQVRELEGAVLGAPPGWRGSGAVAFLVAKGKGTKGVREALQRSRVPMGFVHVDVDGRVVQMLWNEAAVQGGLEGVGATMRFSADGREEIVLTLGGRILDGA